MLALIYRISDKQILSDATECGERVFRDFSLYNIVIGII